MLVRASKRVDFYTFAVICFISIPSFNYYVNILLQDVFGMGSISSILYGILGVVGLMCYWHIIRDRIVCPIVCFVSLALLIGILISYTIYPEISEVFLTRDANPLNSGILFTILFSIPAMISASKCTQWKLIVQVLYIASVGIIFIAIYVYYVVVFRNGLYMAINYMSYSYNMITSIGVCTIYGLLRHKRIPIWIGMVGFLTVIIAGARGAMLAGFVFYIIIFYEKFHETKWFVPVCLISIIIVSSSFLIIEQLVSNTSSFLEGHGIESRTLTKMLDGDLFKSSSREDLIAVIRKAIGENPLFGYGIYGDRYVTYKCGYVPIYAHNIFFEILCQYGLILGGFLLIVLFCKIFNVYKRTPAGYMKNMFLAIVPYAIIQLFFTSSYLQNILFWIVIGILYNKHTESYENSHYCDCL